MGRGRAVEISRYPRADCRLDLPADDGGLSDQSRLMPLLLCKSRGLPSG
jgi:hypothetical protein